MELHRGGGRSRTSGSPGLQEFDAKETAKTSAEARQKAQSLHQEAQAKLKAAETRKTETASRAKDASERAKPREVTFQPFSEPILLTVTPAPIVLQPVAGVPAVKQGDRLELPVQISRLYQFNDAVTVQLKPKSEIKGLKIQAATVEKDQTQGKIGLEAGADATAGNHFAALVATLKLNGQTLTVEQPFSFTIVAPPATASKP